MVHDRESRISQVRHVQLAHRTVGAAETIQQHLFVFAVRHAVQLVLQQLDSLAVAGDRVIAVLILTHTTERNLQLAQIHPLFEVVFGVHLGALHQQLHHSTQHAQSYRKRVLRIAHLHERTRRCVNHADVVRLQIQRLLQIDQRVVPLQLVNILLCLLQ